ncbi:flagellar basal body rod C-terminal domain-containing protein [Pseudomonas sp. FP453]|uniref:flagellar basal body rod C-terminal domain-containing protein n=1 Tax=Pseudomonas sp. FP453 TaxID=2954094 RepID=UPI00273765B0|nr:flagellar basal body rod C-terminal domain-containing protein [Pseudomonas sp. FP453]WLH93128.1 flagellar basal body rod C-terminal domain-containing protein [Pseudomonas sp. FP453]
MATTLGWPRPRPARLLLGVAGSGSLGSILSGTTEDSNVDLTAELVNLIIAQRNFQANAKSVTAQSEVLQQAVNIGS